MGNLPVSTMLFAFAKSSKGLFLSCNSLFACFFGHCHYCLTFDSFHFKAAVVHYKLETTQDFLIKLGIKPLMHLLEISIFLLTKIMNNLVKDLKILSFKVIFKCLKLVESFQKKFSVKNIGLEDQLILLIFFENLDFQSTLFTKNVPNFFRLCS